MNHNFPCSPEGGKISVKPHLLHGKSILGGIYYNLNRKWMTLCCLSKIVVCCYRRDVIVQVGLLCVEGCRLGRIY